MSKFECGRCGKEFTARSIILRHLNAKRICPPKKKNIDLETLRAELTEVTVKEFVCKCGKSYGHPCSFWRHKQTCPEHTTKEVIELKKEIKELKSKLQQVSIVNNNNNSNNNSNNSTINIDARKIYNIWPCDSNYLNFKALLEKDQSQTHAQSFANKDQPETLLYQHMRLLKPQSLSMYAPSDANDLNSVQFFDGERFKRREDAKDLMTNLLHSCVEDIIRYASEPDNIAECEEMCEIRDSTYSTQMDKLKKHEPNFATMITKLKRISNDVKKLIDEENIPHER